MNQQELDKYQKIKEQRGDEYGGFNHAKTHYDYLKTLFNVTEVLTIADIGCGTGKFPKWIAENFPHHFVIGIDPTFAPEYDKDVVFVKGDSTDLPLRRVDILTSFDVMEHICEEDLEKSLQEIARVTDFYIAKICTRASKAKGTEGEELHPTVQPIEWWMGQLGKYFTEVRLVDGLVVCKKGRKARRVKAKAA